MSYMLTQVSTYWPEFGQMSKQDLTVADILRHEGGMPYFSKQMDIKDSWTENIKNNAVGSLIEQEVPVFPHGNFRLLERKQCTI